jgi:hypothetical protein
MLSVDPLRFSWCAALQSTSDSKETGWFLSYAMDSCTGFHERKDKNNSDQPSLDRMHRT